MLQTGYEITSEDKKVTSITDWGLPWLPDQDGIDFFMATSDKFGVIRLQYKHLMPSLNQQVGCETNSLMRLL